MAGGAVGPGRLDDGGGDCPWIFGGISTTVGSEAVMTMSNQYSSHRYDQSSHQWDSSHTDLDLMELYHLRNPLSSRLDFGHPARRRGHRLFLIVIRGEATSRNRITMTARDERERERKRDRDRMVEGN